MRIAIVGSRGIPARYGGFETLAENLARVWVAQGHEIFVTGFDGNESEPEFPTGGRLTQVRVSKFPVRRLENLISTFRATKQLVANHPPDAALVMNDVNYLSAKYLNSRGIKTLLHMDGAEDRRSGINGPGKALHKFFRDKSKKSGIDLVVDSPALLAEFSISGRTPLLITYAPQVTSSNPDYAKRFLASRGISSDFYLVVARWVAENQIIQIIESFLSCGIESNLVILGKGTGFPKYEEQVVSAAKGSAKIHLLEKNYDPVLVASLLSLSKAYIHGHTVGGTNPILVDARAHARVILANDNQYNRIGAGSNERFWSSATDLASVIQSVELNGSIPATEPNSLMTWEKIAESFLAGLIGKSALDGI